jgi:hypothetical protein
LNYRTCVSCRMAFSDQRRPFESRPLRAYSSGTHVDLRIEAWGHICQPCAQREGVEEKPSNGEILRSTAGTAPIAGIATGGAAE